MPYDSFLAFSSIFSDVLSPDINPDTLEFLKTNGRVRRDADQDFNFRQPIYVRKTFTCY